MWTSLGSHYFCPIQGWSRVSEGKEMVRDEWVQGSGRMEGKSYRTLSTHEREMASLRILSCDTIWITFLEVYPAGCAANRLEYEQKWKQESGQLAAAEVQAKGDGALDQSGSREGGEMWSESGCLLQWVCGIPACPGIQCRIEKKVRTHERLQELQSSNQKKYIYIFCFEMKNTFEEVGYRRWKVGVWFWRLWDVMWTFKWRCWTSCQICEAEDFAVGSSISGWAIK